MISRGQSTNSHRGHRCGTIQAQNTVSPARLPGALPGEARLARGGSGGRVTWAVASAAYAPSVAPALEEQGTVGGGG